jgi:hypothetical protein
MFETAPADVSRRAAGAAQEWQCMPMKPGQPGMLRLAALDCLGIEEHSPVPATPLSGNPGHAVAADAAAPSGVDKWCCGAAGCIQM